MGLGKKGAAVAPLDPLGVDKGVVSFEPNMLHFSNNHALGGGDCREIGGKGRETATRFRRSGSPLQRKLRKASILSRR